MYCTLLNPFYVCTVHSSITSMYVLYTPRSPLCMYRTLLNPLYVCTVPSSIPSMYVLYTPQSSLCMYCTLLNPLYVCTVHSLIPSMYTCTCMYFTCPQSPLCMYTPCVWHMLCMHIDLSLCVSQECSNYIMDCQRGRRFVMQ